MRRAVVDLGNSRLKWGWIDTSGRVVDVVALPLNDPNAWDVAWQRETMASVANSVAIATVNPPIAARLGDFLQARGATTRWFQSAADVPVRHEFAFPDRTGADRALAVAAAIAEQPAGTPGLVVLCGTALTVERVSSEGIWQGGAIAAGLGLTARSLHQMTAQLPLIDSSALATPPAWGRDTRSALAAGVHWGVVGAVRELLTRQAADLPAAPWVIWTGGDASLLANAVDWPGARVVSDLVLRGLAAVAFHEED